MPAAKIGGETLSQLSQTISNQQQQASIALACWQLSVPTNCRDHQTH